MKDKKKFIVVAIALLAIIALVILFKDKLSIGSSDTKKAEGGNIKEEIYVTAKDLKTENKVDGSDILKKNKNVMVIWQTKCGPCESELKAVEKLRSKYKNINFVGLGLGDDGKEVQSKMNQWGVKFPNYLLTEKFLKKNESIKSTPLMLFLDKDGKERMYRLKGNSSPVNDLEETSKVIEKEIDKFNKMEVK